MFFKRLRYFYYAYALSLPAVFGDVGTDGINGNGYQQRVIADDEE